MSRKLGFLEVIAGPMYCGKTEELIRQVKRAKIGRQGAQVFKHKFDIRYGQDKKVFSHAGVSIECDIIDQAGDILERLLPETKMVAIDEAQWLGDELIPVVKKLLRQKKHVIVSGLALTYDQQPFTPIPELMALADRVSKLSSICAVCGGEAVYHKRMGVGAPVDPLTNDPSLVKKLGDNFFEARCRNCLSKKTCRL